LSSSHRSATCSKREMVLNSGPSAQDWCFWSETGDKLNMITRIGTTVLRFAIRTMLLPCLLATLPSTVAGSDIVNLAGDQAFESFMASYIRAINNRDPSALERLVHPDCLAVRNVNNPAFNFWLKNELKRTVPGTYRTNVTRLPTDFPTGNCPVQPTHQLQWDFVMEQPRTDWTIMRRLIKDGGRWYLVLP